jgi:putative PIN family toxin of toxin-antitoxin system
VRVVFDTNIYVSAFAIPGGRAEEAYLQAVQGAFDLFTSFAILTETANVLRTKFDWSEERTRQLLRTISRTASILKPAHTLHLLADEADNRILECAIAAEADFIVTGDRHLLTLERHQDVSIITLADFLDRLTRHG